jgi:thiol-disulfide isomerase/thioredoxin/copper chaperone CopZ
MFGKLILCAVGVPLVAALSCCCLSPLSSVRAGQPATGSPTAMAACCGGPQSVRNGPQAILNATVAKGKPIVVRGRILGGGHLSTAGWNGKVVILDFWGTWCPLCMKEAPYIETIYQKYHSKGLEILGVPIRTTATAVRAYLKSHPEAAWPQIFDQKSGNSILAHKFGVIGFPTEFVIDRHGIVRHIIAGYAPARLLADVREVLGDSAYNEDRVMANRKSVSIRKQAITRATYSYHVSGMECPLCGPSLRKKLLQLPGVEKAMASYTHGTARVQAKAPPFHPGAVLTITFHRGAIHHTFILKPIAGPSVPGTKAASGSSDGGPTKGKNACCQ